jgi:signal transduction histidine kinase
MEVKGHILVIDDELGMRVGCQRALSSQGYQVDTAANGAEGLEKLGSDHYDLVLLDVMMAGMGGLEALQQIRALDPDLVCVIITGYATVELAVQAIRQGAYDFVTKPFDSETLTLTVEQGMEKRRLTLQAKRLAQLEVQAQELGRQKVELERLDKVKSTFTLMVAHELRAPVAAIQSYLRLILDGYIPLDQQRTYLERAERRAMAQLELISDLLDLAHLQDPDRRPQTELVDLAQTLAEVVDSLAARATERHIELGVSAVPGLPPVEASPQHIRQLWTNLISNAIKYTPDGGRVSVRLAQEEDRLVGEVADNGIGISQDELPFLFQEFFRTKAAKAHTQMGTGLGLSIVKKILEAYGGTVGVESKVGEGTCFRFALPVHTDEGV